MEFEVLKKSHLKRNILIGVLIVGVFCTVVLNLTRAKYRVTESIPLVTGTINYKVSDLNLVSLYIQNEEGTYIETDAIPTSGYILNNEQSYCGISNNGEIIKDESVILTYGNGSMTFSNVTKKGTKCYLYFDEYSNLYAAKEYLLSKYITVLTREDFSVTIDNTTTGTIYKSLDESQYDNDGEVYYFAGNPTDNWVSFGGYWWRIIRINGNGSIRMIYQGTSANTTGEGTQIGISAFNINDNDNAYVGYMYGTPGSSTYEETHANIHDSTVKQVVDNWYANESGLINYSRYLDGNAGFCGDRTPSTSYPINNESGGFGTITTYYGALIRLNTKKSPIYECQSSNDLYTTSGNNQGNKALIYPVGLISMDEVAYAGGTMGVIENTNYYLYTNEYYWLISPYSFSMGVATTPYVYDNGWFGWGSSTTNWTAPGVRPVINLRADLTLIGSGTTTDPYRVEGA